MQLIPKNKTGEKIKIFVGKNIIFKFKNKKWKCKTNLTDKFQEKTKRKWSMFKGKKE